MTASITNASLHAKNINALILLFISLFFSSYSIISISSPLLTVDDWCYQIVISSTIWMIFYIIIAIKIFRHIYLFSTAYLTALILFHLGLLYQRAIGYVDFPISWENGVFSHYLRDAGWHIILAISAFGIGFSIAMLIKSPSPKSINIQHIEYIKKNSRWSAIGLLLASIVFFLLALKSYGNLLNYARHEIFSAQADSRGFGAFMMVFPGAVLMYFFSSTTKKQKLFGASLVIFSFLMFMLAGYRSAALFPLLIGSALWVKSGRRLPLPIMIGGVIIVLTLIAASGYLRGLGKYSSIEISDISRALSKARMESSISEMGASIKALASVLQFVPEIDAYRYGSSYMYAIIDAVPNIRPDINTETSRKHIIGQQMTDKDAIQKMRPADWLTYRIAPWHFKQGYGVGFSAIAEAYLNFSTPGVLILFIILGYTLGRLDCIPLFQNQFLFIFSTTILWTLTRTVRNDSSNFFKPAIFILLILALWWGMSKILSRKNIYNDEL